MTKKRSFFNFVVVSVLLLTWLVACSDRQTTFDSRDIYRGQTLYISADRPVEVNMMSQEPFTIFDGVRSYTSELRGMVYVVELPEYTGRELEVLKSSRFISVRLSSEGDISVNSDDILLRVLGRVVTFIILVAFWSWLFED